MIRGPSGGGKTTMLNLIGTIDASTGGNLNILNEKIDQTSTDEFLSELRLKHIGFVFQTFNQLATMSALENVELPMILLGKLKDKERKNRAIGLLKRVGLGDRLDHLPSELSGGEQQRLSIAAALAKEPRVLLLDEPFVHLDVHLRKKLGKYIRDLCFVRNMIILLVTHEGEEALSWSDEVYCMFDGRLTNRYSPDSAYFRPKTLKEGRFFGELNSVRINEKQILFRPKDFKLSGSTSNAVKVAFQYSEFRGHYHASYFKLSSGREVVLYGDNPMTHISEIYVGI